ncbi:hypothetical protein [Chitinasiproducens palmae]|uniref:Uncharacterized protein n=1 Tax=Chitinasiproducens palmae TaxID=1770053 RepID=A0A1H2PRV6_9BURK|nr:hypothetical protein [Chitinasiproducens palmae]SDV49237.1 hypothetical protein SAMN05216551_107173 [Chitinasiproducens palmae]
MRSPFDLTRFMAGDLAETDSGAKVRFVAHVPEADSTQRVVGLIFYWGGAKEILVVSEEGKFGRYREGANSLDLFMAPRVAIAA